MARRSIQRKIVTVVASLLAAAVVAVALLVWWKMSGLSSDALERSGQRAADAREKLKEIYQTALQRKGENQLAQNSMVLLPLYQDNSYGAVKNHLSRLFAMDDEILSLEFFVAGYNDEGKVSEVKAWQILNRQFPQGPGFKMVYDLKGSSWQVSGEDGKALATIEDPRVAAIASSDVLKIELTDFVTIAKDGQRRSVKALECSIPVLPRDAKIDELRRDGESVAYLRYVLTLEQLEQLLKNEEKLSAEQDAHFKTSLQKTLWLSLIIIGASSVLILLIALVVARSVAARIARPVQQLNEAAALIAAGDYSRPVEVTSDDEVGDLAKSFEHMRSQVKSFTENLQDMVDDKTRQITEILNAIDQGIITLGMDLKAGAEHSQRARKVLGFADFAERPGSQILRLDAARTEQFHSWLKIVRDPKKLKRWEKYVELCPAQELLIKDDNGEERIIGLDYRPILDKDGSLIRLMVLASDVTEARQTKLALDTFRREQQGQMDRIVGLVNSDSGTIAAFTAAMVVSLARAQVLDMLAAAAQVHELFRDFHTLKGNAGSLGFSSLAQAAGLVEDVLERLRAGELPADLEEKWKQSLTSLNLEVKSFQELKDKLFADQDGLSVDRTRYEQLLDIATHGQTLPAAELANALLDLDAAPFESLCRKYGNIVAQYREANGRQINDIHYYHGHSMIRRSLLRRIDNSLVHLVRNAVDHGLEDDENRQALGKGPGQITLSFTHSDESLMISVSDDGRGIDADAVAASAVRKGVISAEEANKLGQEEKIHLIFLPGFSTKEAVSETSGRGVGMDAVKSEVEAEGGSISIRTQIGQGTSFTINLPV